MRGKGLLTETQFVFPANTWDLSRYLMSTSAHNAKLYVNMFYLLVYLSLYLFACTYSLIAYIHTVCTFTIYICMYTHTHIYIYIYMYMYMYKSIYIYIYTYKHT